jgi:hypothetical protein
MERRDIMVIAGALLVVLILAVVVKPMLTGQAPNLGLPEVAAPSGPVEPIAPPPVQETPVQSTTQAQSEASESLDTDPLPVQTTIPGVGSGDLGPVPTPISWQPDPENPMPAIQMVEYADIVGKYTGKYLTIPNSDTLLGDHIQCHTIRRCAGLSHGCSGERN